MLDRLTKHRDVICVDLPGFGESPPLPDHLPYELDSVITVLAEFFDRLGLCRPHVAGNSMGGFISLVLAQQGLVRSATALSPAGLWTPRQRRRTLITIRAMHRTAQRVHPLVAARLAETAAGRALLAGIIVARPALLEPRVLIEDIRALVDAVAFAPTLAAGKRIVFAGAIPDVPVTIAWGTRDRIMRRPQAATVTRLIPHARLLSLPGCGHIPMTDDPALVAHVLLTGSDERSVREGLTAARDGDPPPLPEMQSA